MSQRLAERDRMVRLGVQVLLTFLIFLTINVSRPAAADVCSIGRSIAARRRGTKAHWSGGAPDAAQVQWRSGLGQIMTPR